MLPNDPGHSATVLVALAEIGGTPSQTIAGNVISVPPPAIELTAPPISAARKTSRNPAAVTRAPSRSGNPLLAAGDDEVALRIEVGVVDLRGSGLLGDAFTREQLQFETIGSLWHFDREAAVHTSGCLELRSLHRVDRGDLPVRHRAVRRGRDDPGDRAADVHVRTRMDDGTGVTASSAEQRRDQQESVQPHGALDYHSL